MKRMEDSGDARRQDWARLYSNVPGEVNEGVQIAFVRIRTWERRRARAVRALACAACLALALGVGIFALSGKRQPDRVTPPVAEAAVLDADTEVYASMEDAFFHILPDCPQIEGAPVRLKVVAALEFEKALCPICGADIRMTEGT